jgi:hypothetical protein
MEWTISGDYFGTLLLALIMIHSLNKHYRTGWVKCNLWLARKTLDSWGVESTA